MHSRRTGPQSERAAQLAYLLLRVSVGVIFAVHGWAKLNALSGTTLSFERIGLPEAGILVYLAVLGELFGGLALLLGLFTRVAALGPLCTMLVAIFSVHLSHGLLAKNGGFEYPLVLLLVSALFAFNGAGAWSVDELLERHGSLWLRQILGIRPHLNRTDSKWTHFWSLTTRGSRS